MSTTRTAGTTEPVGTDLVRLLKALKLGALADTLPERAALARQHKLSHIGFLEVLLADEVNRRDSLSTMLRATKAGLDPAMAFDSCNALNDLRYDRTPLGDLTSLRFLDAHQSAIILGPVGVGKTRLATALGHRAIRRRHSVLFARSDKLFTRFRAARLDNTVDAEIRRLTAHSTPGLLRNRSETLTPHALESVNHVPVTLCHTCPETTHVRECHSAPSLGW